MPNANRDRHLEECISRLNRLSDSLEDEPPISTTPNLSKPELAALSQLIALVKDKKNMDLGIRQGGINLYLRL